VLPKTKLNNVSALSIDDFTFPNSTEISVSERFIAKATDIFRMELIRRGFSVKDILLALYEKKSLENAEELCALIQAYVETINDLLVVSDDQSAEKRIQQFIQELKNVKNQANKS
jgi:hypothetical protein